jgi:hypothetical protein
MQDMKRAFNKNIENLEMKSTSGSSGNEKFPKLNEKFFSAD